jgi:hypothetical protein
MNFKIQKIAVLLLSVAGSCALEQAAQAQFSDANRDLILTFRKTGFDGGSVGSVVFEVDIGQASTYYSTAPGTSFPITQYSASTQLGTFFDSVNDMSWSVCGCVPNAGDNGDPSIPTRTLWVTAPRLNPSIQTTPWTRGSIYSQGTTDSRIVAILNNANEWGSLNPADSSTNSPADAAIPAGNGDNASGSLTALGNFGTFQGDIENTTPSTFNSTSTNSVSDLYELEPGSGAATYLGYFVFTPSGSMTFNGPSTTPIGPMLTASTNVSGNFSITFPTVLSNTYTLYYTNSVGLTAPVSTWPIATNITGTGAPAVFVQPFTATNAFYVVGVQ